MKTREELKKSITKLSIMPMKDEDRKHHHGGEFYNWVMLVYQDYDLISSKAIDETMSLELLLEEAVDVLELHKNSTGETK